MIKMMFKYELKKIFSKRINQVLLAAVLVVTIIYSGMAIGSMRYVDEEGQDHTGIEAGRLLACLLYTSSSGSYFPVGKGL